MRATRLLVVLLGLVLAGAFMGAVAGAIVGAILGTAVEGLDALGEPFVYGMGALYGAGCGAVLAPVASFSFLRHVPLWRVFVDTTVGTILGGVVGAFLPLGFFTVMAAGTAGFFAAAARLAWSTPRRRAAALPPPVDQPR